MRLFLQRIVSICGVALLCAAPVAADDHEESEAEAATAEPEQVGDFEETGFYLVGTALYAIPMEKGNLEDSNNALLGTVDTNVDDSWGGGGRIGYRVHKSLGLEAEFDMLNTIELDAQNAGGIERKTEIRVIQFTGNAKGYLATGRFQPYVLAGGGWGRAEFDPEGANSERDDGFLGKIGAGLDIYGSRDVALTTEISYVFSGIDDLDHLAFKAGLVLRFYPLD